MRKSDFAWLRDNEAQYAGKWVALRDGTLIAADVSRGRVQALVALSDAHPSTVLYFKCENNKMVTCSRCLREYPAENTDGPTVAPSERLAAEYGDDPRCRRCWGVLACDALTRETEKLGGYAAEGDVLAELEQLRTSKAAALAVIDDWMNTPSAGTADESDTYSLLGAIRAALKGN